MLVGVTPRHREEMKDGESSKTLWIATIEETKLERRKGKRESR